MTTQCKILKKNNTHTLPIENITQRLNSKNETKQNEISE